MIQQKKPTVSITIAALNEEKIISKTVKECLKIRDFNVEVFVVIDSKTTDNTQKVAEKAGATVIDTGKWKGKGAALRKAMKSLNGDFVVQIDADYQFMPYEIPKMIKPLMNGYDVTLGSRYEKGSRVHKNSVTKFRRIGIWGLSLATSIAAGIRVTDVLAGFKAFKIEVLKDIKMKENQYGYEAEVVIRAAQKGYKIKNVPITYKRRTEGNSNVVPLKDGFIFLGSIIKIGLDKP